MDPKDRSDMGGSSDAKNDVTPDNFDGNTLKIDHNESAPVVDTPAETPKTQPDEPEHIIEPEKPAEPVEPVEPAKPAAPQPTAPTTPPGVPVNPLARKAPDFMGTPRPVSTPFPATQGDIPLTVAQPPQKKSKMPILVVAIVSLVVIIGVAVFAVLQKQNSNIFSNNGKIVASFNQYANYFLFEQNSNEPITDEYSSLTNYSLTKKIQSGDKTSLDSFLSQSQSLFNNFMSLYTEKQDSDADLANLINEYGDNLDFVRLYLQNPAISNDDIIEQYKQNKGLDQVFEFVDKSLKPFSQSSHSLTQQYATEAKEYWRAFSKVYYQINTNGCVKENGSINSECYNDTVNKTLSEEEKTSFRNTSFQNIIDSATPFTIQKCWEVTQKLGGN